MKDAPLDNVFDLLPSHVRGIVERDTPIPTISLRAAQLSGERPELVRADIGQISGLDESLEVLYGPPVGIQPLRALIAETWNLAFGLGGGRMPMLPDGLSADNVATCTGAAEGLTLLFHCFAHDKVVGVPRGHWENYTNGVELAGGRVVTVDFFDGEGNLDIAGLSASIEREGISVLIANFPNNPTGAVLNDDEFAELGALLERTGVIALADEVYSRLRFDGQAPVSLLPHAPGNVVAIGSASKEYLLPGARVGYIVSAHTDLTNKVLRKLIRANSASPNVLGQRRLLDLMRADLEDLRAGNDAGLLTRVRDEMKVRRDLLVEVLERHGFETVGRPGHQPEGTIFLMAALPDWWNGDDAAFAQAALEAACVSTVPGSAFGIPSSLRFSFGGMTEERISQLDANLTDFRASLA